MRRLHLGVAVWCVMGMLGCTVVGDLYPICAKPNYTHRDESADLAPCEWEEADERCPGTCIPAPEHATGWEVPALVWMGPEAGAPVRCPDEAPTDQWTGYIIPPKDCGVCRCDSPAGSCRLPTEFTAHAAPLCPQTGAAQTSFDALSSWGGACTTANPIQMNADCPMGSNVPCVQSLSMAPMEVEETGCAASVDPTPALVAAPIEPIFGKACSYQLPVCNDPGKICAASVGHLSGFRHCVYREGEFDAYGRDYQCPAPYWDRLIFYGTFTDHRTCSECTCGVPMGSTCTAQISIFSNSTCSGNPIVEWTHDNLMVPQRCLDLSPGVALMSKMATDLVYTPGTCEPFGGNPIGHVKTEYPYTVCCLP